MPRRLVLVAGEASGDLHGAALVAALRAADPTLEFSGIGGPRMRQAGVALSDDLTRLALIGVVDVLRHFGTFRRVFYRILDHIDTWKPDAVICIDYPGFNLRLAREVKRRRLPLIYYISPQVWAWHQSRVRLIREVVDHLVVILPFEPDFYRPHGIRADFVGHPLLDLVRPTVTRETFLSGEGLSPTMKTITLAPGSRVGEINRHLPLMLEAAARIARTHPGTQFLLPTLPTLPEAIYTQHLQRYRDLALRVVPGKMYDALNAADLVLVASGTATLETAIAERPMIIVYKTSFWTWLPARLVVRLPYIGLVNVVAGKQVVPELIQFDATPERLAREALAILDDPKRQEQMRQELRQVKAKLGEPGAAARAARSILHYLDLRFTRTTHAEWALEQR